MKKYTFFIFWQSNRKNKINENMCKLAPIKKENKDATYGV